MAIDLQRFGVLLSQNTDLGIGFQRKGQINQIASGHVFSVYRGNFGHQRGCSQTRTNRLRDLQRGSALRHLLHAAIREFYLYGFGHISKSFRLSTPSILAPPASQDLEFVH